MEKEDFFHEYLTVTPTPTNPFGYRGPALTDERLVKHRRTYATRWTMYIVAQVDLEFQRRAQTSLEWRTDRIRKCQNRFQRRGWQTEAQNAQMDFFDFLKVHKFNLKKLGCLSVEIRPIEAIEAALKVRNDEIKRIDSRIRDAWNRWGTEDNRRAWTKEEWEQLTKIQNEVGDIFGLIVKDAQRYRNRTIPRIRQEQQNRLRVPASTFRAPPVRVRSRFASAAPSNTGDNYQNSRSSLN